LWVYLLGGAAGACYAGSSGGGEWKSAGDARDEGTKDGVDSRVACLVVNAQL